jgi:chromatin remodeling complex protein RSC6
MDALSRDDKLELVIKDLETLMDASKSLSARMKVFHREALKSTKKKSRKADVEVDPDAPKAVASINKPVVISNELCEFLGFPKDTEHSRNEVTTTINKYVKDNDLQDPQNKRYIRLEGSPSADKLKALLRNPDQPLTFFNIQRYLKPHYPMSAKDKKALSETTGDSKIPTPPPLQKSPPIVQDLETVEESTPDLGKSTPRKKPIVRVTK